jgi:hypothetical protein
MRVVPITFREACAFVLQWHRHHKPPCGSLFQLAAADTKICGVVMVGRPVARMLQDGWTAEVIRLASDGTPNACSFMLRAAWRAAAALGWNKLITYTLPEEGGASLRGAGFRCIGVVGGGSWSRKARPRIDLHPLQTKLKWELES